jgi:hypothetical protein
MTSGWAKPDLAAPRRDGLLDRAQRVVHVSQLLLGRHAFKRALDLLIAAKILFAVDRMLHLLVELGLRPRNGIRNRGSTRIEVDHRYDARADQGGEQTDEGGSKGPTEMEPVVTHTGTRDDGIRGRSGQPLRGGAAASGCHDVEGGPYIKECPGEGSMSLSRIA